MRKRRKRPEEEKIGFRELFFHMSYGSLEVDF